MYELLEGDEGRLLVKLLLDEVLHSLHVVVGHALDLLHASCISLRELLVDATQVGEQSLVNTLQLGQGKLAKHDKILDFNTYAVADERILREILG